MAVENKIVLITGGANGIGFAYAEELLRNGAAHVAVLDLLNSNGEEAVSKLNEEFGKGKSIFVVCDVSKPRELEAAFARTAKEFGGLDIVINNAGIMNDSKWELMINVNYNAVVRGTILGFEYMGKDKGSKGGTIVNISSIVGVIPSDIFPIYSGTKHAVVGLSRSFALPYHYEKTGIRILTLCPSATETQLITKSVGRSLDAVDPELIKTTFEVKVPLQKIENVARSMTRIIEVGRNGGVWIVENNEPPYEIELPNYPLKRIIR